MSGSTQGLHIAYVLATSSSCLLGILYDSAKKTYDVYNVRTYDDTCIHAATHVLFGIARLFPKKSFSCYRFCKKKKKRRRKKTGRTKNQETFLSEALLGKPICYVGAYVYLGSGNTLSRMNNVFSRS